MNDEFNEQYEVNLDYQMADGYWVISHKLPITVRVKHGVNEKNSHALAEVAARAIFPGCRINSVTYC